MNQAEIQRSLSAFGQAAWLALAFEVLVFSAAVGFLMPVFQFVARRTGLRLLAAFAFMVLALGAYVVTAVASVILEDHYIYSRTGTVSLCHLTGWLGKLAPIVGGVLGATVVRARRRLLDRVVGSALVCAAVAFIGVAATLWFEFPQSPSNEAFFTFAPHRNALGFVAAASFITGAAGIALAVRHQPSAAV